MARPCYPTNIVVRVKVHAFFALSLRYKLHPIITDEYRRCSTWGVLFISRGEKDPQKLTLSSISLHCFLDGED